MIINYAFFFLFFFFPAFVEEAFETFELLLEVTLALILDFNLGINSPNLIRRSFSFKKKKNLKIK